MGLSIKEKINCLKYLFKTIHLNYHYFGFCGLIHPFFLVCGPLKISKLGKKTDISIPKDYKRFSVKLGYGKGPFNDFKKSYWEHEIGGKIILGSKIVFTSSFSIVVRNKSTLAIGNGCTFNSNLKIKSEKEILIGDNCMIGWNVTFIDTDGHPIFIDNSRINEAKSITIGEHVWIGANVTLLKGVKLPDETIVGYGTIVTKTFFEKNTIICGNPNEVKKNGIIWDNRHF